MSAVFEIRRPRLRVVGGCRIGLGLANNYCAFAAGPMAAAGGARPKEFLREPLAPGTLSPDPLKGDLPLELTCPVKDEVNRFRALVLGQELAPVEADGLVMPGVASPL